MRYVCGTSLWLEDTHVMVEEFIIISTMNIKTQILEKCFHNQDFSRCFDITMSMKTKIRGDSQLQISNERYIVTIFVELNISNNAGVSISSNSLKLYILKLAYTRSSFNHK